MIEMHFWEQLAAIAECGTISAASEKLHLTQPALSRSMKKLEDQLGVSLFERQKNRIALNDTGKVAAKCAVRLLSDEADMIQRIIEHDAAQHTIRIGCCAPVPMRRLLADLTELYPSKAVAAEMKNEETLLTWLEEDRVQVIVLSHPMNAPGLFSKRLMEEHFFFAVTNRNPLAERKSVSMRDINGQTILLLSQIGEWYDICKAKLPDSRLLFQDEPDVFKELISASELPFFISSNHLTRSHRPDDRIYVPSDDEEMHVTYYCICKNIHKKMLDRIEVE